MKISKRIFKPAITLVMMSAMLFSGSFWPPVQGASGANPKSSAALSVRVTIYIGRPRHNCTGFGICRVTIDISATSAAARGVRGELSTAGDGKLQLALLSKAPEEGQTLFVDEDIALSPDIARKLGLKSATIVSGEYQFSASKSLLNARLTK